MSLQVRQDYLTPIPNWKGENEKYEVLMWHFFERGMQLHSQRVELYQSVNLLVRLEGNREWLSDKLYMRTNAFQEYRARKCQQIEE